MKDLTFTAIEDDQTITYKIVKVLNYKNSAYIIYTENNRDFYASKFEIIDDKLQLLEVSGKDVYEYLDKELEAIKHE